MKTNSTKRLSVCVATAVVLANGALFAQQPMPAPAKPENARAPESVGRNAPTASQGIDALFKRIDSDSDGALSKPELEKFDPEAAKSFEKYDADKDTKLSLSEFDAMVKGLRGG
jgi:EF hand